MIKNGVCLVTSGHVASNPRLIKEANALAEAGYRVHVVSVRYQSATQRFDETVYVSAPWNYTIIKLRFYQRIFGAVMQRVCRRLIGLPELLPIVVCSHSSVTAALKRVISGRPADLYVAHNLAALPAAAAASKKYRAKLGFDAEDFHTGELEVTKGNRAELKCRKYIEQRYFPVCSYLTSSSPSIAEEYKKEYGARMTPILNVFPITDANSHAESTCKYIERKREKSIYWFSQTISKDRGLDIAIRALTVMKVKAVLNIRGTPSPDFEAYLWPLTQELGITDRVKILDPKPPGDMVRLAAEHDIGLSLENCQPRNRDICLTNKIFTYLLAGIPQIMTRTTAQAELAPTLGDAAILVDSGDAQQCANALDVMLSDEAKLERAKSAAYRLARDRFNWDLEKNKFLRIIENALSNDTENKLLVN